MEPIQFEILKKKGRARAGILHTPSGDIETPAFVAVGTKGTVKSLTPEMLKGLGSQIMLSNTYHLYLQPGDEIVRDAGGLHKFANWNGPMMTDSGGFQVFSLGAAFGKQITKVAKADIVEESSAPTIFDEDIATQHGQLAIVDEEGVTFTSHINGSLHRFTPERSIEIQHNLGADLIVAFDECTSATASKEYQKEALDRTHRWAERSWKAHKQNTGASLKQGLFGVVQGGRYEDLRRESAKAIANMPFDGFAIGGSYIKEDLDTAVGWVCDELPEAFPRHLLGIGEPDDLISGIQKGVDLFDCVAPTRIGRNGTLYVREKDNFGKINILNAKFVRDLAPIMETCGCYTCQNYTRAYLAHLFRADEMLGATLASIHNMYFIVNLVKEEREKLLS
jgi:queuine tRNA-ribosyltransferase